MSPTKVEALLALTRRAWNGIDGEAGVWYGIWPSSSLDRRSIRNLPGAPMPWEFIKPPEHRVHPVPIAYVGNDIEVNLEGLCLQQPRHQRRVLGNFLSAAHVELARRRSRRKRIDWNARRAAAHGGCLIVATETPLPDDIDETRSRFLRLDEALRPAFLSREATSNKRGMLGWLLHERPPLRSLFE